MDIVLRSSPRPELTDQPPVLEPDHLSAATAGRLSGNFYRLSAGDSLGQRDWVQYERGIRGNSMQVLSRPRSVSLIVMPESAEPAQVAMARHDRGFTLVELLVALAVGAILVLIAVPSFQNITLSSRLTTAANDIVGAIYTARMEAIKLNANTQLCSDSATNNTTDALGTACTTQTGAVWALVGGTPTQIRAGTVGISTPLQLNGDMTALRFSTAGLGQLPGTAVPYTSPVGTPIVDICTSAISSNNHRIITMTTGSIIVTTTTSGACPG